MQPAPHAYETSCSGSLSVLVVVVYVPEAVAP